VDLSKESNVATNIHNSRIGPPASTQPVLEIEPGALAPFIPRWFREAMRNLSGAEVKVLLVYISRADKHGIAWPSIPSLCQDAGLGVNSVKSARSSLVATGSLRETDQERHGGKFSRKSFRLAWKSPCF